MRLAMLTGLALIVVGSRSVAAQAAQCASAPVPAQDACHAVLDLFQYMTPQLGISFTGGNVTLAQGGALGGLPRFSVGARANVINGNLFVLQTPSATGPALRTAANPYPTKDQYIGLPGAEASIGLWRGISRAGTSFGGIDALVSASYIPTLKTESGDISIEPDSPLKIGYGVRVGLIEETVLIPGVAVSYMLRDLPTTTILATIGTDSLQVTDFALKTTSLRVTAGKSFTGVTISGGVGQDTYDASTGVEAIVNRPAPVGRVTTGALTASQKITRLNYFASVSINLLVAKLVAEAGMISGGDVVTSNVFDIAADASRTYGSLGLRIGY
jgi:hypothetical protein